MMVVVMAMNRCLSGFMVNLRIQLPDMFEEFFGNRLLHSLRNIIGIDKDIGINQPLGHGDPPDLYTIFPPSKTLHQGAVIVVS